MFHKKTLMTLAVFGLILTAGIGTSYAFSGDGMQNNARLNLTDEQKQEMQARHEDIEAAIELGDYDLWLETVGTDSSMAEQVTQDEFPTLIQAHNIMEEARGLQEQARELMESIGVENGPGKMGHRMHKGFGNRPVVE